jgi:hypothetical protein
MSDLLSNWETVIPHLTEVFRNKIGVSEQELVIIDLNFDNLVEYCCLCLFCRGTSDDLHEMKNVDQRFVVISSKSFFLQKPRIISQTTHHIQNIYMNEKVNRFAFLADDEAEAVFETEAMIGGETGSKKRKSKKKKKQSMINGKAKEEKKTDEERGIRAILFIWSILVSAMMYPWNLVKSCPSLEAI